MAEQTPDDQRNDYLTWRRQEAKKLGLPPSAALRFAELSKISVHDLEKLVKRGCDPLVALDILL